MKPGPKARPFWSLVEYGDGCWEWTGSCFSNGYGLAVVNRKSVGAHRRAYELTNGPIPAGLLIMHSCDNKKCVNPEHLSLGTPADNMADMVAKGRSLRGERNHRTRLTADDVVAIRARYVAGGITQRALADEYDVVEGAVWNILHNRVWKEAA